MSDTTFIDVPERFDWTVPLILLIVLALSTIGILFIYSASHRQEAAAIERSIAEQNPNILIGIAHSTARRQIMWLVISICACLTLMFVNYRVFKKQAYTLWALSIVALAAVLVIGREVNGAKRWFAFGPLRFQPSEAARVCLVLAWAKFIATLRDKTSYWTIVGPLLLTAPAAALIVLQPDLGMTLSIAPALLVVIFVSGVKLRYLIAAGLAGLATSPALWFLATPYQRSRVFAFFAPHKHASGSGYQVLQSLIAIGSGGLFGRGLGHGTQNILEFLPQRHTDFIFAVICEEWGLVGAGLVILLYLGLIVLLLNIASGTKEPFGRLIVIGCTTLLATQIFVNIGMTMRLCPITGLTLPFISYGGSSLLTCFGMIGLALSVRLRSITFGYDEQGNPV